MSGAPRPDPFGLTTPCGNCPWRRDRYFWLAEDTREVIAASIRDGQPFHCHRTLDYSGAEDRGGVPAMRDGTMMCAGFLATMERDPGGPNAIMQIGARMRLYDPARLNPEASVYPSLDAWVAAGAGPDSDDGQQADDEAEAHGDRQ